MALNWRIAYVSFVLSLAVALASIIHSSVISSKFGHPNSAEGIEVHRVHLGLSVFLIILSVIGFTVLLIEYGNKIVAMLYTVSLFTCILLSSFVIIRTIAWANFSDEAKLWDLRNASIDYIVQNGRLSPHLLFVQDHHECCGVQNILEWSTMLNIKRRVPDSCCVPAFRKRRCGEKALPYKNNDEIFCGKRCEEEFDQTTSKVDLTRSSGVNPSFNEVLFDDFTTDEQRNVWRERLKISSIDPCTAEFNSKLIYFFKEVQHDNSGSDTTVQTNLSTATSTALLELDPWPAETICYELYEKDKGSFEDFLLSRIDETGRFYTQGCMKHLLEYTEKLMLTGTGYSVVMGILAFIDIIVFYHYYWKFRLIQLAKLPLPVWFEKLGPGDKAPIGIGRKTVTMPDNQEEIIKDLRRAGILIDADSTKARSQGGWEPHKGRYRPVRVYHPPNKTYPTIELYPISSNTDVKTSLSNQENSVNSQKVQSSGNKKPENSS